MARMKLELEQRDASGSRKVKRLRAEGIIPGIVYGRMHKPISVQVSLQKLHEVKGGHVDENALLDIVVSSEGKDVKRTVIVKEIQRDPLKGDWLHIDFNEISLTEKIKTVVPLAIKGEAKGVAEGGSLDVILHELEIECLPTDIPERIDIDVTALTIGDTVYVKDIAIPKEITLLSDPEHPAVSVAAPRAEEEVAPVPAEGEAEEPEVIGKGKKVEEGEEAAGEAAEGEAKPKAKAKAEEKGKG